MAELEIKFQVLKGETFTLTIPNELGINELKQRLETEKSWSIARQRLVFKGKVLVDSKKLSDYKIKNGDAIKIMLRKEDKKQQATSTTTTPSPSPSNLTSTSTSTSVPSPAANSTNPPPAGLNSLVSTILNSVGLSSVGLNLQVATPSLANISQTLAASNTANGTGTVPSSSSSSSTADSNQAQDSSAPSAGDDTSLADVLLQLATQLEALTPQLRSAAELLQRPPTPAEGEEKNNRTPEEQNTLTGVGSSLDRLGNVLTQLSPRVTQSASNLPPAPVSVQVRMDGGVGSISDLVGPLVSSISSQLSSNNPNPNAANNPPNDSTTTPSSEGNDNNNHDSSPSHNNNNNNNNNNAVPANLMGMLGPIIQSALQGQAQDPSGQQAGISSIQALSGGFQGLQNLDLSALAGLANGLGGLGGGDLDLGDLGQAQVLVAQVDVTGEPEDFSLTLADVLQLDLEEKNSTTPVAVKLISDFLKMINLSDIPSVRQGDYSSIQQLHPSLRSRVQTALEAEEDSPQAREALARDMAEVLAKLLDDETLVPSNTLLSPQVTPAGLSPNLLRVHFVKLLNIILTDEVKYNPTPEDSYVFASMLKKWGLGLIGSWVQLMSRCLVGGVTEVEALALRLTQAKVNTVGLSLVLSQTELYDMVSGAVKQAYDAHRLTLMRQNPLAAEPWVGMLPEAERVEWVLGISDDIKKQQLMLHLGETQRRQLIDSFGLEEHEAQAIPRRIQNPLSTAYQSGVDGKNKPSAGGETLKKLAKKKFDIDEKLDKSLTSAFALRGNDETVLAQNESYIKRAKEGKFSELYRQQILKDLKIIAQQNPDFQDARFGNIQRLLGNPPAIVNGDATLESDSALDNKSNE